MKAIKKALARIKDRRGETIAEVLVALLVSSLGIVTLAAMINSSASLVRKSRDGMAAYAEGENAVVKQSAASGSGTVTIIGEGNAAIRLTGGDGTEITVQYYENGSNGSVRSYKVAE